MAYDRYVVPAPLPFLSDQADCLPTVQPCFLASVEGVSAVRPRCASVSALRRRAGQGRGVSNG
jgi:hypothetical protein